jgi:transposase
MKKADKIKDLLRLGKSYKEIAKELGVAGSTIAYHAKKEGLRKFTFNRQQHDWSMIQHYYDLGYSLKELIKKFNIDYSTIDAATKRGEFVKSIASSPERRKVVKQRNILLGISGRSKTLSSDMLVENSTYHRKTVKHRILNEDLLEYSCSGEKCPLNGVIKPVWADKPVVLHLDHINGVRNDHRLENLRFLCPNCHSQTETYSGKNNSK